MVFAALFVVPEGHGREAIVSPCYSYWLQEKSNDVKWTINDVFHASYRRGATTTLKTRELWERNNNDRSTLLLVVSARDCYLITPYCTSVLLHNESFFFLAFIQSIDLTQ